MQDTMLNKFFVCKKYSPMRPTPKIDFSHLTTDILVSIQADTDEYRKAHIA